MKRFIKISILLTILIAFAIPQTALAAEPCTQVDFSKSNLNTYIKDTMTQINSQSKSKINFEEMYNGFMNNKAASNNKASQSNNCTAANNIINTIKDRNTAQNCNNAINDFWNNCTNNSGNNDCTGSDCNDNDCTGSDCNDNDCTGGDCGDSDCTGSDCNDNDCTGSDCDDNDCTGSDCDITTPGGNIKPENPNNNNSGNNNNNNSGNNTGTEPSTPGLSSYEQQVVDLVNKERAAARLSQLKVNTKLSEVAEVKAADMRDKNYFSHTSPTYGSPFDMMKQFGVSYKSAGENIAKGQKSPATVMNGWMNSAGHKANILSSDFTEIGVGYVTDSNGGTYWVQMFIRQ